MSSQPLSLRRGAFFVTASGEVDLTGVGFVDQRLRAAHVEDRPVVVGHGELDDVEVGCGLVTFDQVALLARDR